MEIVNFNKDKNTRTIKFTFENGKTKIVNQKLHLKSNNWFEAICYDKNFKLFKDCPDSKINFTKVVKMQILQLENSELKSSNNQEQSSNNQEQSSRGEKENEPDIPDPLEPAEHLGECGPEIC